MNQPTDVGRQGQAVTPAMRARVQQPRKDVQEDDAIGMRGSSRGGGIKTSSLIGTEICPLHPG